MSNNSNITILQDQQLLIKIKDNPDYLGIVYKQCKSNSFSFMKKMTSGSISDYDLEDIFQDANIILYEKIVKGDFELTSTFQTYLNSVCRFQLLNTIGKSKLTKEFQVNIDDNDEKSNDFNPNIMDSLEEVENENEPQFLAIERAMEILKNEGRNCYDLLVQFWYHRKKMDEIASLLGYTNAANTKNQKSRCQDRLRLLAYNELKSI